MSYPKKSPTSKAVVSKSISVDPKRERLLAIQERERVKDQLVNKFAAKYAKDNKVNKVLVNKQVAEFLQHDNKVTEENLKKLEQRISEAVKDRANGNTKGYVAPIETAPNEQVGSLKKIDDDARSVNSSERPRSVYIQGKGNDEWAAIAKYDTELYKNELLAAKRREQEQKKNIKAELDRQIAYKKQVQRSEADELKRYVSSVQEQVKLGEEKERKKIQDMHNKILHQKHSRDQQLLDELNKKKQEKKSEKLKDDELVKKLKQEMDEEARAAIAKKAADKEYMKKVFKDNEDYKKKAAIEAKIQKEADIKAQQEYTRLIEKQMADRETEVKEREERAKKFMSMMADTVVKNQKAQELEEEKKLLKNYADREQREHEEDRRRQATLNDKKQEMRNYLNLQLQEKERKKQEEKELERKQAEIWRQDAEEFRNSEKLKSQKFKESVSKNAEYQKQQIQNSAEKQRKMNNEEALYNKPLLKNIAAKDKEDFVRKTLGKQRI